MLCGWVCLELVTGQTIVSTYYIIIPRVSKSLCTCIFVVRHTGGDLPTRTQSIALQGRESGDNYSTSPNAESSKAADRCVEHVVVSRVSAKYSYRTQFAKNDKHKQNEYWNMF